MVQRLRSSRPNQNVTIDNDAYRLDWRGGDAVKYTEQQIANAQAAAVAVAHDFLRENMPVRTGETLRSVMAITDADELHVAIQIAANRAARFNPVIRALWLQAIQLMQSAFVQELGKTFRRR